MSTTDETDDMQMFPPLDEETEAGLRSSIERFGVIQPIVVDQDGRLLDGHHRRRIALELGKDCPIRVFGVGDDADATDVAATLNLDRRHLDPDQRRRAIAHMRSQGSSLRTIARAFGVDARTVRRDLDQVGRNAPPETVTGLDGKQYPSVRPPAPGPAADDGPTSPPAPLPFDGDDEAAMLDERPAVSKPDLGGGVSHPATFSAPLLDVFRDLLEGHRTVLDPFAGTGKIHQLRPRWETTGVEIEPEWANLSPHSIVGDALDLPFDDGHFEAICTSPTYGNRLADHHSAADASLRRSYRHDLGRDLHDHNSGALQWGQPYRAFHLAAWTEAIRVLAPGGVFVLNIKDHIRTGSWQDVAAWHVATLVDLGLRLDAVRPVVVGHLKQGANAERRVPAELVVKLSKPFAKHEVHVDEPEPGRWSVSCSCGFSVDELSATEAAEDTKRFHLGEPSALALASR